MKLTALFMLLAVLQISAHGYSQEISVSGSRISLKEVFLRIEKQSPYSFLYNNKTLKGTKPQDINIRHASIDQVLAICFKDQPLTYHIVDNTIIISRKKTKDPVPDVMATDTAMTIRGKVVNEKGDAIPGASILVKGSQQATISDDLGIFELDNINLHAVLVVSSIGYERKEIQVENDQTLTITLKTAIANLEGVSVVVTALGINRQKRTLTYATQALDGADISNTRDVNISSALDGKVAGLLLSKTNAGPGSSNRIIFRGNRSITGDNQPLIVVDGVPIDNTPKAFTDVSYNVGLARDNGDGISNINPDDIASVTVLTGASAAALYGSEASNGAIIITTKKGRIGKGIGVSLSSSLTFENPMLYPKLQNTYGQGVGGNFDKSSDYSWGPEMTGQQVEDWTGKTQALTPQPDNFKDFFRTGTTLLNTVVISTGTEKSQTYFSYTNTLSQGIIPNNDYKRNNLNLRQTNQITKDLSVDMKINYIVEDIENRPLAGGANHAMATLYAMPRSLRINDIKNFESVDPSTLTLKQNYWGNLSPAFENPYWAAYRNLYDRKRNRLIGMLALKYQLTPELSIQGRSSLDYYTDNAEEKDYNGSPWLTYAGQGNYVLDKGSIQQFNNDVLLTFNKDITNNWNLVVNAGASIEQFSSRGINANTHGLVIANSFSLGNGLATVSTNSLARTQKQSVYADAEIGFKNYLFLNLTGRNDWNSTLPVDNASYFFPSAGLSAILSDMLKLPAFVSLLKVRTSYAFVGNGTGFNQLKQSPYIGAGGNGGFLFVDRVLHNADLKPEETRSFEAGLEFQLFNDRLGADITYYKTNTINQILQIDVPNPSGYAFRIINAGNIQNQGLEMLLNATPVRTRNFTWNILVNFGRNKNKILRLDSLQKKPPLSSPETLGIIVAEEGKSYGGIYTTSFQRNDQGQVIVGDNGLPLVQGDQYQYYAGNYNPDWTGGITNTFRYKDISLSLLIDERKGGIVISGTQALMAAHGTSELTVPNRGTGFVVPNSVTQDGAKNTKTVSAEDYWRLIGESNLVGEAFVNDATNIRLREINLTYDFSSKLSGTSLIKGLSVSLIGRNLLFLKNNAYGFDPETAIGTGNNQGLEYTPVPGTRSYGIYLKLNF